MERKKQKKDTAEEPGTAKGIISPERFCQEEDRPEKEKRKNMKNPPGTELCRKQHAGGKNRQIKKESREIPAPAGS